MELLLALSKEAPRHCSADGISITPTQSPRTNYYQSVFRIDGQPILPPLMTKEKRFEMIQFKKLAMEREARRYRRSLRCGSEQSLDASENAALVNEVIETKVNEAVVANQFYDALHAQQFVSAPKLNCESKKFINASTCTDSSVMVECKRIQNLQRSETIIYDNRCNSILMPKSSGHELRKRGQTLIVAVESEYSSLSETDLSHATSTQPYSSPSEVVSETAIPFSSKRPQSLTFETATQSRQKPIPAICVNPPTPQVDTGVKSAPQTLTHDFVDSSPGQSDDQCECLHTHKQMSNSISSKMISYEHSNCATITTTTKPKSPCGDDILKRSATSPSLKIIGKPDAPDISNSNILDISNLPGDQTQHLMRSNSFTLERPSQVLLEHMERHQTHSSAKTPGYWTKTEGANTQQMQPQPQPQPKEKSVAYKRSMTSGNLSHQANFRRDTVESKAKRVNKIEVKQRTTPVRNTAKFKQKTTLASSRPISATSNIYRTAVSAVASPNASSSILTTRQAAQQVEHSYKNSNTPHNNSNINTPTQHVSVTSLPLNKNKPNASEPRVVAAQPQSQQQQLPIKRASKKVTNPAKPVPSPKPSRSLANRMQHSSSKHANQLQNIPLLQQEYTGNNNSPHEQPPVNPQAQAQAQTHQQQLEQSQQLQLKLQQLQEQRQSARSALSPTLMSQQMLSEIESAHRQKFMLLITQQHEEQRRLQAQFDAQQKLLLEQICSEMTSTQISCDNSRLSGGEYATYNEAKYENRDESTSSTSDSPGDSVSSVMDTTKCRGNIKSLLSPSSPDAQVTSNKAMAETTNVQSSSNSSAASTPRSQIEVSANGRESSGISTQSSHNLTLHLSNSARKRLNFDNNSCAGTPIVPTQPLDLVRISDRVKQASHHTLPRSSTVSLPETRRQQPPVSRTRLQIVNDHEHEQLAQAQHRCEAAATKINACARGFLVRRLFRTEQIQRIVQTIRDTLIFVLNLHLETSNRAAVEAATNEDTPANVRLKARLLQQLCSASRTLHLVFFQTTLRERMEIIARDRKRMKAKLIAVNMKRAHITQ